MDRRSDKKIAFYIAVWLVSVAVMTVAAVCFLYFGEKIRDAQMTELIVTHPELEKALTENSRYYQDRGMEIFGMLWGFLALGIGLLCCVFYLAQRIESKKQKEREKDWQRDHERLKELGDSFSVWKRRMTEEENNTKALITDISHQLKTPLAALRMSYELTMEETLTDSERKEFAAKEEWEIRKLELLLEELLKLSQLETGMVQITPQDAGIRNTILNAVEQVFVKAHQKQMEIRVKQESDVIVRHDPKWMAEAVSNILDNAVKYSNPGSPVEIRVNSMPGSTMIEIEDWGMGIAADELHKIFQRFYRGREAEKLVRDGAGIGLYLVRSVIERQGGTVVAKRKAENGMIFRIMLPTIEKPLQ